MVPVVATEERDVKAVDEAASCEDKLLAVVPQEAVDDGKYEGEFRQIATAATVVRMAKAPDGSIHAILQGVQRIKVVELMEGKPGLSAKIAPLAERKKSSAELDALMRDTVNVFREIVELSETMPKELIEAAENMPTASGLADFIAGNLQMNADERYEVLKELDVNKRLTLVRDKLSHEMEVSRVQTKIQTDVHGELEKRQRDFILREQMKAIQRELGEGEITPELSELQARLVAAKLPENAKKEADRELQRLSTIPSMSPEYQVARTYLEWLADLP